MCACVHAGRGGTEDVPLGATPAADLQQLQQGARRCAGCSLTAPAGCGRVLQVGHLLSACCLFCNLRREPVSSLTSKELVVSCVEVCLRLRLDVLDGNTGLLTGFWPLDVY